MPDHLNIPDEMIYAYMIHRLAKAYNISKIHACSLREYDFWEMLVFENLDMKKEEFLVKQNQEE